MSDGMIGSSPAMKQLQKTIDRIAAYPRPVLIRGERGVGKEMVARLLHERSPRARGPFVEVNAAGLAPGVIASEILGHEAGAFTSATSRRIGRLEMAHGGTLFLDEIGIMPVDLQRLFLRVIERQRFERVGGSKVVTVDVRILAATNADLEYRVEQGEFHPDLLDRLRFAEIRVPALRERREDIPELAKHFLSGLRLEMPWIRPTSVGDDALLDLTFRPWPGNVRELRAAVETGALMAEGPAILETDLPRFGHSPQTNREDGFYDQVAAFESKVLREALARARTMRAAAQSLKLSYDQIRRLINKHGLS